MDDVGAVDDRTDLMRSNGRATAVWRGSLLIE